MQMDGKGEIVMSNIIGIDTEFELELQKSKDKEFRRLFWNELKISDFIALFFFSFDLS